MEKDFIESKNVPNRNNIFKQNLERPFSQLFTILLRIEAKCMFHNHIAKIKVWISIETSVS